MRRTKDILSQVVYESNRAMIKFFGQLSEYDNIFHIGPTVVAWSDVTENLQKRIGVHCVHLGSGKFQIIHNPYLGIDKKPKTPKKLMFDTNEIVG